jgi:branched-chain amino acid transport system substrate-binding protein
MFGVGSWATPDFIKLTGEASEGIYAAVPYASTMTTPKNKAFVTAYTGRYNEAPGKYSAAGYNAINILAEAITRAGSTDPEKLRDALGKTDYEGPNGHFQFDSKGQASGFSVVLVQLLKGVPTVAATSTIER